MLSQQDLTEIEKLLDDKLDEKFRYYPTKDELFNRLDALMKEVKAMRDSQELHSGTHTEISDRIENLEKVLKSS